MDREELGKLIEEQGKSVYSFCCHLTGSRQLADDLYQDTFLKAFELSHKMECEGNPKSYVLGIAVRLWQNQRRKQAVRQRIVPLEEYRDGRGKDRVSIYENLPEQEAIRREQQERVRMAVTELPEKIRHVMYLYYTAEMQVNEIADILHVPSGTVKSRLNKGRNLVKKRMEVYVNE